MRGIELDKRAVNDLIAAMVGGLSYPELAVTLELLTEARIKGTHEVQITNAVLGFRSGLTQPTVTSCTKSLERIGFFARTPGGSYRPTVYLLNIKAMREFAAMTERAFERLRIGDNLPSLPVVRKRTRRAA